MFLLPENFNVNIVFCVFVLMTYSKTGPGIWTENSQKTKGGREAKRYLNKMFTVSSN